MRGWNDSRLFDESEGEAVLNGWIGPVMWVLFGLTMIGIFSMIVRHGARASLEDGERYRAVMGIDSHHNAGR